MVGSEAGLRRWQTGDAEWRRASRCAAGECVEISSRDGFVMIRDSTEGATVLRCSSEAWRVFTEAIRAGEFDDLG
jgi:hypothetical protein